MAWHEEMLAWLESPEPPDPIDRLVDLGLQHKISWAQVQRWTRALESGNQADVVIALFGAIFSEAQLETLPRALGLGADPWELLLLGVHGRNCEGEDLVLLDDESLLARLETAVRLGQEKPSAWLRTYATLLVQERARRRGDGGPTR